MIALVAAPPARGSADHAHDQVGRAPRGRRARLV